MFSKRSSEMREKKNNFEIKMYFWNREAYDDDDGPVQIKLCVMEGRRV